MTQNEIRANASIRLRHRAMQDLTFSSLARDTHKNDLSFIKDPEKFGTEFLNFLDSLYYVLRNKANRRQYDTVQKFVKENWPRQEKNRYKPSSLFRYHKLPIKRKTIKTDRGSRSIYQFTVTNSTFQSEAQMVEQEETDEEPSYEDFFYVDVPEDGFITPEDGFEVAQDMARRGRLPVGVGQYGTWYNSFETANYAAFKLGGAREIDEYDVAGNKNMPVIVEWRPKDIDDLVVSPFIVWHILGIYDAVSVKRLLVDKDKETLVNIQEAMRQVQKAFKTNGRYLTIAHHRYYGGTILPMEIYAPDRSSAKLQKDYYSPRAMDEIEKYVELKIDKN